MGVKRPFDEETIHELLFKQAKQVDGNYKPTLISEDNTPHEVSEKAAFPGEPEDIENLQDDKADKETTADLSWVTSSSNEEETENDGGYYLPLYPDFMELNFPRTAPIRYEDAYSYFLDKFPRKEVPVGPNHQADIPEWNANALEEELLWSNYVTDDHNEQKYVGTSIIPMPDSIVSSCDDVKVGCGRIDCDCVDKGSIRCVRQHVEEARGNLRESIGEEKFADLGFLNMGEEVALTWTEEEERVFEEVVYSNPVSCGKNFWKTLSAVFPSRTNMELISYYFNVFTLRRRAVQNRSNFLEIDSDDDEWQGDSGHPEVEGGDDDSVVETFGDADLQVDPEMGMSYDINDEDDEDEDDKDDDDNDDDDGDGNGDVGSDGNDVDENADQEEQILIQPTEKSKEEYDFDTRIDNMAKALSSYSKDHDAHANIYFGRHSFTMVSCSSGGEDSASRAAENGVKHENIRCLGGKMSATGEGMGSAFILDTCEAKAWDDMFSTSHIKSIDLLPTCSMIEEIFGP